MDVATLNEMDTNAMDGAMDKNEMQSSVGAKRTNGSPNISTKLPNPIMALRRRRLGWCQGCRNPPFGK